MNSAQTPLAERMRPQRVEEYIGQSHLLGPGQPLQQMISTGQLRSLLFWGPPGTGKTTLARLLAQAIEAEFHELSAISAGVKDLRAVIESARNQGGFFARPVVLFIDEIHRFNKAQQDALLHSVETGEITLIGATTENPSFEVIPALLSRCPVYTLKPYQEAELQQILERALAQDPWLREQNPQLTATSELFRYAGGDARVMLNRLELAVQLAPHTEGQPPVIDADVLARAFQHRALRYDKGGEEHYNIASAMIKSIRGSDPDAAVYWIARMLAGGEDPKFIARRLIIVASEDIGNAEPYAMSLATACFQAVQAIGMPEARIILGQTATYLASCPKSNAAYQAINAAMADAEQHLEQPVPLHLRNAPTRLMKEQGYGEGYQYSHDFAGHFSAQQYLPDALADRIYYAPSEQGREKTLKARLDALWEKRRKPLS
jgi:putative ATPase